MKKIVLDFQVAGCPNHCFHCHCCGGDTSRALMEEDLVRRIACAFREKLGWDVSVHLLEEQTYYKDFFKLLSSLEADGFIKKDSSKMLVSNCWGLANIPGFIDELKEHYSCVKPTLFGIDKTHDIHAGRKGSYIDIIEASRLCSEKGIEMVWELMWTKLNTKEIDALYEIGNNLGVKNVFISGEYYYTGPLIRNEDRFLPVIDDIGQVKHEIYEYERGYLKIPNQYVEDIKNGKNYDDKINKINFDEIYIDKDLNVYPLCHLSPEFCLGNIRDSFDRIIEELKEEAHLPEAIINNREMNFSELLLKNTDVNSNKLYAPEALFNKLILKQRGRRGLE